MIVLRSKASIAQGYAETNLNEPSPTRQTRPRHLQVTRQLE
jgi:hypothetical protein